MSRFSPQVLPQAAPGFVENLANAFQQGFVVYDATRQRKKQEEADAAALERETKDRLSARKRQQAFDAAQGIFAPGSVPRETLPGVASPPQVEYGQDYGPPTGEGLASAMGEMPPVAPTPQGVVPGAFDPRMGKFARPRLPVQQLPGGYRFDPNVRVDAELAKELGTLAERQRMEDEERSGMVTQRLNALRRVMGQPGYEGLTEEMAEAIAIDAEATRAVLMPYGIASSQRRSVVPTPRPAAERPDPIETAVCNAVTKLATEGVPVVDEVTGQRTTRPATDAELAALAARLRRTLTGAAPEANVPRGTRATPAAKSPADRWEELVDGGMSSAEATAQVRREFPQ